MRSGVEVSGLGKRAIASERREFLGIPLLDHAEATEFALLAVKIAVVVGVAGDEAIAADAVVGLDALNDMYREGQPGDPRLAGILVLQIELGGGGVLTRVSAPRLLTVLMSRCGFCPPIRST